MDKQIVIYPSHGILIHNEKEVIPVTYNNMDNFQKYSVELRKQSKECMLFVSIYMKFYKRQNYSDSRLM